jgi:hypothetical protein
MEWGLLIFNTLHKTGQNPAKLLSFFNDLRKPPGCAGRRKNTTGSGEKGSHPHPFVVFFGVTLSCHFNPPLVISAMPYPKMLLTSRECAIRLGVSRRTVQRWLASGDCPSVVLPRVGARAPRHLIPFPLSFSVTQ